MKPKNPASMTLRLVTLFALVATIANAFQRCATQGTGDLGRLVQARFLFSFQKNHMKAIPILFGAMLAVLTVSACAQSSVKTEAGHDQENLNARNNYPVIKEASTKTLAEVIIELEAARLGKPALSIWADQRLPPSVTKQGF